MKIEIFERFDSRLECRTYEVDDDCYRVLIDKDRQLSEVWGFIKTDNPNHPRQVEGKLIDKDENVILMA